jgi:mannose-1-phosphate guanylyltransferase
MMKAYLLAAGKGTRLKPFTDRHPKCLVPINGVPLLQIWLDLLQRHGVGDVLINTHHHAVQVDDFIRTARQGTAMGLHTVHEPRLLGSAGTLWKNRRFVEEQPDFLIAYADNLTDLNLTKMIDFHRRFSSMGGVLTMALIHAPDPRACGIVTLDKQGRVVKFTEKPEHPESDLANAGVYIASRRIFDYFDDAMTQGNGVIDIGHHLLPKLTGRMAGYPVAPDYLRDIGTPEALEAARARWPVK